MVVVVTVLGPRAGSSSQDDKARPRAHPPHPLRATAVAALASGAGRSRRLPLAVQPRKSREVWGPPVSTG